MLKNSAYFSASIKYTRIGFYTMKIRFHVAFSAVVVVSLANAKSVSHQNPVTDNLLGSDDSSLKQSSDVNLPISHIGSVGEFTTDTSRSNALIALTSENATGTMFIEETSNNTIMAYTTSEEEMTTVQTTTIIADSVETVTESTTSDEDLTMAQTTTKDGVFYTTTWWMDQMTTINEYGPEHKSDPFDPINLRRNLITIKPFKNCQDGYTANKNGKCVLKFEDLSN